MWKFQVNESGQTDGWNDNGIQTFRSNILKNLAREIVQNSVDARASKSAPAEVEFTLDDLDKDLLPDFDQLNDYEICKEFHDEIFNVWPRFKLLVTVSLSLLSSSRALSLYIHIDFLSVKNF